MTIFDLYLDVQRLRTWALESSLRLALTLLRRALTVHTDLSASKVTSVKPVWSVFKASHSLRSELKRVYGLVPTLN